MKKYAVFAGDTYYPDGGWNDFAGWADDPAEIADVLRAYAEKWHGYNWCHAVDISKGEVVEISLEG